MGTLNSLPQDVQTPTAGVILSHLTTLRIRGGMKNSVPHFDRCQEDPVNAYWDGASAATITNRRPTRSWCKRWWLMS